MYTYAQILNNQVHLIFQDEHDLKTLYADFYNKDTVQLVDITNLSPQPVAGWSYDGTNFTAPVVVTPTDAELHATYEVKKNALLALTDAPYACDDYTLSGKLLTTEQRAELKAYRQALRDATKNSYPNFPEKPSWLP